MAHLASGFTETYTAVHKFKPCLTQWGETVDAKAIAFNTAMPMLYGHGSTTHRAAPIKLT